MSTFLTVNLRWLAVGFILLFSSSFGQTFFISLSAGEIRDAFSLSSGTFGMLYMLVTLLSALILSWCGAVLDQTPLARLTFWILLALAAGALCVGLAQDVVVLFAGIFALRLFGQGMLISVAFTAIGRWFIIERGRASSISALGFNAGEALLPLSFVLIASTYGWRVAWVCVALFLVGLVLPLMLPLARIDREVSFLPDEGGPQEVLNWTRSQVLRDPAFYLLLMGMLPPAAISSAVFLHQGSLMQARGWEPEIFASSFIIFALVSVGVLAFAGKLVDRLGALHIFPFHVIPLGVACLVLGSADAPWAIFVFMALYAVTDAVSVTLGGALWPDVYGTRHLGAIRAILSSALVFATAIGPGLSGFLIDSGFPLTFQISAMGFYCLGVCPVLILAVRRINLRLATAL